MFSMPSPFPGPVGGFDSVLPGDLDDEINLEAWVAPPPVDAEPPELHGGLTLAPQMGGSGFAGDGSFGVVFMAYHAQHHSVRACRTQHAGQQQLWPAGNFAKPRRLQGLSPTASCAGPRCRMPGAACGARAKH